MLDLYLKIIIQVLALAVGAIVYTQLSWDDVPEGGKRWSGMDKSRKCIAMLMSFVAMIPGPSLLIIAWAVRTDQYKIKHPVVRKPIDIDYQFVLLALLFLLVYPS